MCKCDLSKQKMIVKDLAKKEDQNETDSEIGL